MWKTYNAGQAWFPIYTLPAVYVTDVEYGADGNTVVATVFRDNQTQTGGGGGIYVSRTNGDFWARPPTGIVPANPWTSVATSAYPVSRAPDERGL
jgi:predicted outer membrane repeat protein